MRCSLCVLLLGKYLCRCALVPLVEWPLASPGGGGGAFPGASLASRWDPKSWVGLVAANALGLIRGGGGPTALEVLPIRLASASCDMYCVRSWTPIAPLGGATSSTPPTSRRTATTSLHHALGIITLSPTCNRPDRPTDRVHKSAQAGDKTDTAVRKTRSFLTHPAGVQDALRRQLSAASLATSAR